ncbi:Hypothetical predicted protein [Paramuricea clavata]|uniref:Uncharacterized protein n=1 Tax=Paramuricea clavata TaxID=317549 RepID=A0A7D9EHH4_PARCT|nr:Hypothetical predicted protein [Paramuricea clavata]
METKIPTSSDEESSGSNISNKIFIALFCTALVVIVFLGILVGCLWKKLQRNQDNNNTREMQAIDEQSGATSENDVLPYVIVQDNGVNINNGASFTTSGNNINENSSAIYEEALNYQPLQRNPLEYLNDENNYQSLIKSQGTH